MDVVDVVKNNDSVNVVVVVRSNEVVFGGEQRDLLLHAIPQTPTLFFMQGFMNQCLRDFQKILHGISDLKPHHLYKKQY